MIPGNLSPALAGKKGADERANANQSDPRNRKASAGTARPGDVSPRLAAPPRRAAGQWVAYHGDQLVGFAKTARELYQECERRGYRGRDYIVYCIEPELPEIIDSPYPFE
jgi:hypothetical protein